MLDAWGICNIWWRMTLPHAQPQLQEHVGVKVMLCSCCAGGDVCSWLSHVRSQLLASVKLCRCWPLSFLVTFSILQCLSGLCMWAAAICWPAAHWGLCLQSRQRCHLKHLNQPFNQHLKLCVGNYNFKWSPCILRSSGKELLIYMVLPWTQLRQSFPEQWSLLSA